MWPLYILMSVLAAGVVLKILGPLVGRGRLKHGEAATIADYRLFVALIVALPMLSMGLYLRLGSPDLPGYPATLKDYQELSQRHMALLAVKPFETLVKKDPHDIDALVSIAQINLRIRDFSAAIDFYRQAVAEADKQDDMRLRPIAVALGEVQVEANKGVVGDDAVKTFKYILALHADNPIALYYLALRKAQDGKYQEAIRDWEALLEGGYPEIYWKKRVREKIAETRAKL